MSKSSLNKVLKKVKHRLVNSKTALREAIADKEPQRIKFTASGIINTIEAELKSKEYNYTKADIAPLVNSFLTDVFSNFGGKKGFKYRIVGTPTNFSIFSKQTTAKGSVFKLALRQELNPFLRKLESGVAKLVGAEESSMTRGMTVPKKSGEGTTTSRGFIHLGHTSSISKLGPSLSLDDKMEQVLVKNYSENLMLTMTKYGFFDKRKKFIEIELESQSQNSNTVQKQEAGILKAIAKELDNIDLSDVKGSPSLTEEVVDNIIRAGKGQKPNKAKTSRASKNIEIKKQEVNSNFGVKASITKKQRNWLSLVSIINAKLEQQLKSNMGAPSLVNRTGSFAASARIVSVYETKEGFPSFGVTYDKTPYGVFDRTTGATPWNTPARDPHNLINKSIRDIAQGLAIGRFYTRRE